MNFIKNPNLPENKVKFALADNRVEESIKKELYSLGVECILVDTDNRIDEPISSHPDIHFYHFGQNRFLLSDSFFDSFYKKTNKIIENIDCEIFNNSFNKVTLSSGYPNESKLNAVQVGKYLICNTKCVSQEIIANSKKEIIHVNQGYTKCSSAIVAEDAIITDDISIYNSVKNVLDVLLIEHGAVQLKGYDYGFIGGACGKISKNELAFYGDIKKCNRYNDIISFCKNHGVECISLSSSPLYDYGSLIPIIEY